MEVAEVLRRRLAAQRLTGTPAPSPADPADVVRLLTCVQSQELAYACWSVGMRSAGATWQSVVEAFDAGTFVRTHVLRPTWHFVAAEDLRWVLALTAPRVQQRNRTIYRKLGLDQRELDATADLLVELLRGGRHLTRPELRAALEERGYAARGLRLAPIVMNAELEGRICSGPMRGARPTYAALEERLPAADPPADPLAELALRFVAGHGPTSARDLARWASLRLTDARAALDAVADRLLPLEVQGEPHWTTADAPEPVDTDEAFLLPLYDEATLTSPRVPFPVVPGHPHPPDLDTTEGAVVVHERDVGTWRRTVKGRRVLVSTSLAPRLGRRERAAVDEAVDRFAAFLGREPVREG